MSWNEDLMQIPFPLHNENECDKSTDIKHVIVELCIAKENNPTNWEVCLWDNLLVMTISEGETCDRIAIIDNNVWFGVC